MSIDIDTLNETVNNLAVELISINPADINSSHAKKIQNDIAELLLSIQLKFKKEVNQFGDETYYSPLINKKVPIDVYNRALVILLGKSKKNGNWYYDQTKGTFITYLKNRLIFDLNSYYKKKIQDNPDREDKEYSEQEDKSWWNTIKRKRKRNNNDENQDIDEVLPDYQKEDDTYIKVFHRMIDFAQIIYDYEKMSISKAGNDKTAKYFSTYFTFDTTKAVRLNPDLSETAYKYSELLFKYIDKPFICFLIDIDAEDKITTMHIVINTKLREGINLEQRGMIIATYHNISHPTENKYSQMYDEIKKSIFTNLT